MPQDDQHISTEQLSAFLDQQLSPEEQSEIAEHTATCLRCQQRLADLRQTVTLLRALPQLQPPRSFLLTSERREPRRLHYLRNTLRTASVIAALFGFIFLVSALYRSGESASTGAANAGSSAPVASPHKASPEHLTPATPKATLPVQHPALTEPSSAHNTTPGQFLFFNLNDRGGRLSLGALLCLLGVMGLIAFKRPWKTDTHLFPLPREHH